MKVVNWNVQWATPRSERSPEILSRIQDHDPEVICLTETNEGLLGLLGGHVICSQPDHGHRIVKGRRKVLLWSREPWYQVDDLGSDEIPPGRFISGKTRTSLGETTVIGICIPWAGSRTARFGGRSRQWEDHEAYLEGLASVLSEATSGQIIVAGDFNQSFTGRSTVPRHLRSKLQSTLPPTITVPTAHLALDGKAAIDHIALGSKLDAKGASVIDNRREGRKRLSDHFGVVADLCTQD